MKHIWQWILSLSLSLFVHKNAPTPVPPHAPVPVPVPAPSKPTPVPSPVTPTPAPAPPVEVPIVPTPVVPVQPTDPAPVPPVAVPPTPPPFVPPSPVVPPPPPVPPVNPPTSVVPPGNPPSTPAPTQPVPVQPTPTFTDDFSLGHLDTSKWIPSDWGAPGNIPGVHKGTFSPSALDFSHGCLRIKVSQVKNSDGSVSSQGGELQSKQTFGFGTYEWIFRASSTSATPQGSGTPVTGQISSGFIFQQDKGYTEIDCPEIQGDEPNKLSWSTYLTADNERNKMTDFVSPEAGFHSYKTVWAPDKVSFYVDGVLVIGFGSPAPPQNPAYAMINHWGTNSTGWGGMATPGVDRYMFVKSFSFTPA